MSAEYESLKAFLNKNDRFCKFNSMKLAVLKTGYAEAVMSITEDTLNGADTVQGGAIFTLCDLAFAGAANSHGNMCVAMSANINYIRPGTGTSLKAVAKEVNRGKKTAIYDIEVFNDENKLIAKCTISGFVLDKPLPL